MHRTLVTGGSGFIGQHLVAALRRRGDWVRVLDRRRLTTWPNGLEPHEFISGSVNDRDAVALSMKGIHRVFHLAALTHLWIPDRAQYDRVNRQGTETVLAAASEHGADRVVHCSTDAVLVSPHASSELEEESVRLSLDDMAGPYTRSKHLAEQAAVAAADRGLNLTIVNPTVPIGPGDYNVTPPTAMLAMFLRHPPKFVLNCNLNLVDVRDVAEGMILAAAHGRRRERYILGGENIGLPDLVQRVSARATPVISVPKALARFAGRVSEWWADGLSHKPPAATLEGILLATHSKPLQSTKARRELGYRTRSSRESLADALTWISRHLLDRPGASPSLQPRPSLEPRLERVSRPTP